MAVGGGEGGAGEAGGVGGGAAGGAITQGYSEVATLLREDRADIGAQFAFGGKAADRCRQELAAGAYGADEEMVGGRNCE